MATQPDARKWYAIRNEADDTTRIDIYDTIGADFWTGEGVTAKQFAKDLRAVKTSKIDLHLNSDGGKVFDGIAIYNALKQHKANVTVHIDGIAASIASVIAMAGDEVRIANNAFLMIHEPTDIVMGNADDLRGAADALDKIRDKIADSYASRSEQSREHFAKLMKAETWLTADEAKDLGLVDAIDGESDGVSLRAAACVRRFERMPDVLKKLAASAGTSAGTKTNGATPVADANTAPVNEEKPAEEEEEKEEGEEEEMPMEDKKEDAEKETATASAKPATIAELKTLNASADFQLACLENSLTLAQAKAMLTTIKAQAPKRPGGPGLSEARSATAVPADWDSAVKQYRQANKCDYRTAARAVAREHPEIHKAYVENIARRPLTKMRQTAAVE